MASSSSTADRRAKKKKRPDRAAGQPREQAAPSSPTDNPDAAQPTLRALLSPSTARAGRTLAGILLLAFALRVYNLLDMFPILVDESIYLRWAEIIDHQGNWFISLLDGKPPLSYWFLAIGRMAWEGDPLLQGRLIAAFVGLLSTIGVFVVTREIARQADDDPQSSRPDAAGLVAAGLYAVFPWALLYDRLAYTEAFVNLFGIAISATAVLAFSRGHGWRSALAPGLALGLGLFTKQTAILFALVPAAAALYYGRPRGGSWLPRLALVYTISALFLGANFALTPEAPTLESHDAVLHHTGFFVDRAALLADPLVVARPNAPKLLSYIGVYLTWPLALAALASAVWLGFRSFAPWLLLTASLLPAIAEVFLLALMFPTRYPFPHFWPWLAVAALGAVEVWRRWGSTLARSQAQAGVAAAALLLVGPLLYRDAAMLGNPQTGLHPADVEGFLGDHAHVGYGIQKAIEFLEAQAARGGYVLLTDPIWGPPADAIFPYLNQRRNIRVYEAWWTQLSGRQAILPGTAEILRSHYERTKAGKLDFSRVPRVLYVTDTHYYPRAAVLTRQPNARLLASFPKLAGHSIDVYQLK